MEFNVCHRAGVIIFSPSGEIIGDASREFREVVAEQLASTAEAPKFLFDFAAAPMMDSTGLGVLIGTRLTLMPEGGQVALLNPSSKIKTLIAASKLTTVFEEYSNEEEAIAALTSG
ncbi:STAS domain-containing protein [Candidatus Poribacteria bacterium]|nr:STAS domain-containing protein [Candidatus Poribacteria bacterium]